MLDVDTPLPAIPSARVVATPPRRIPDEDLCPVCHLELPPKGPDGDETAREMHINFCIESSFSSSAPRPPMASLSVSVNATGAVSSSSVPSAPVLIVGSSDRPPPQQSASEPVVARRRTTGMVVFHATEKDCIGEDGKPQECNICYEDYAEGDEMGRLECFCKFHKKCIRKWWDTKGVGACPTHRVEY
jgi:hypothetical protein